MEGFAHLLVSEGGGNAHSEKNRNLKISFTSSCVAHSPQSIPHKNPPAFPRIISKFLHQKLRFAILGFRGLASVFLFSWGLAAVFFLVFELRVFETSGSGYFGGWVTLGRGGLLRGGFRARAVGYFGVGYFRVTFKIG